MTVTPGEKLRATSCCCYIPDEILLFNILNRLPVQPLVTFKSVSKHWNAMIEDPDFVQSHAKHNSTSASSLAALFQVGREYFFVPKETLRHFHIQTSYQTQTYIVGICNGLLCFRSRYGFEICNPCTSEFLYNPLPPHPLHCSTCYGFYYDPLNNQYKFIQIVHGGNFYRCMVYTFGTDNDSWKDITAKSNLSSCLNNPYLNDSGGLGGVVKPDRALYSKGALHWYFRRVHMIMSFDIHREKFDLIKGPVGAKRITDVDLFITEWEGCMSLFFQLPPKNGVRIFKYKPDVHQYLPYHSFDLDVWGNLIVPIPEKPIMSKTGCLGGASRLLYWFTQGHVSFYSPKRIRFSSGYSTEDETSERFPLPRGVDHSLVTQYEFMHHIDNPLSLKTLLPPLLDQVGPIKNSSPMQVRSVSSL